MSQSPVKSSTLSRRRLFAGAGVAGAVAAVAAVVPSAPVEQAASVVEPQDMPRNGGGYRVSEHVKRYYQTTQV